MKLVLKQGEAINGLDGVRTSTSQPGDNDVTFKSVVRVAGEVTYALELTEIPEDRFKENNRYDRHGGRPRQARRPVRRGQPRARELPRERAHRAGVRRRHARPASCRRACARLERYDFVILSDAPAERVSLTQQDAIESYVRDLGGGFLFAGGESGYGLGGWYHTTIERILPVRMDAEKRRDEPEVAMALVIDRSGSMTGLPLEMAKQAAKATADTLAGDDLLEVIAFDSQPTRIVKHDAGASTARASRATSRASRPAAAPRSSRALDAAYQSL